MPSRHKIPDSFDIKVTIRDSLKPKQGSIYRDLISSNLPKRRRAEKAIVKVAAPALVEILRDGYLTHLIHSSPKALHPKSIVMPIPKKFTIDTFNAAKSKALQEWGKDVEDMVLGRRQMAEMRQLAYRPVPKPTKRKRRSLSDREINRAVSSGSIIAVNIHEKNVENWLELVYELPSDPIQSS